MTAKIIDGKSFAQKLRSRIASTVAEIRTSKGIVPGLAVILVGQDPASEVYVRNKAKQTSEVGMESFKYILDADVSEESLLDLIDDVNRNDSIHGLLVQLPLPDHIDSDLVINSISPQKDVDGFHISNVGLLSTGQKAMVPCTPLGCKLMLLDYHGSLSGMNAVVVGRSNIVGKPMANLLLQENCTVTIAHSRTRDLPAVCREADILVAAVGRPNFIKGSWIKPGATVIDVGINRINNPDPAVSKPKLVGDVDFDEAIDVAGAITPVPGGVGPMTIACLLANTVTSFCRTEGLPDPNWVE
ncbi:MAG: bifunctional methylenetetrahydrofolate dehydrogenase/methenyltetrahydrofolate cyclohydrolase FolD [Rhodobacteraceae bacterium]|nr:bifunctional methylenetetrahydrofolate dehydrogenase/methenyltetrahydrofolate cyclohydrolase FolD [Paracoccaceae bacterium]MXZ50815.1 bifunctional methylenetetrahydrofolate dehydrogenase/methenyltetrahydrofolate cyclohydrolase FolD [Paracoccaceae bacterium]MYF45874.1 bifunctional methylenetetrahydrofolate dehydrogenase/methenyltetrahydrofolate cyclohydrolase FolD [Paracoccaceae bacterium]MYI92012.1 bifunctional methylenetetrahydrofolate dehydrogenase/methenyltetrahydrofolate cyclohydrolase Fo